MAQEFKQKRKVILKRMPPGKALEEIARGNKFVVVEDDIDESNIPDGYTLVDLKYKNDSFKTLVPEQLMFYIANPGEGSIDDALDEVSDFYGNVKDFEDDAITEGAITNVQSVDWATTARNTYQVYLINKLTGNGKDFDKKVLHELNLDHPYVEKRIKAIAALALEKPVNELKKSELGDILEHITVDTGKKELTTVQELQKVRCDMGSHYEYRDQYVPVKRPTAVKKSYDVLNRKIGDLENEIHDYRMQSKTDASKSDDTSGRHDAALIRQYINMAYIAKDDPSAQLDIMPAENKKENEDKKDSEKGKK